MTRRVVWLQMLIGWLPLWALFAALIIIVHGGHPHAAGFAALRMIIAAAALAIVVNRITERVPWPRPVRPTFVMLHLAAAFTFSVSWLALNSAIESVVSRAVIIVLPYPFAAMIMFGVWLYVMVAGVSYSAQATERAARAEAAAAKAQLAALRSQLNPHFLFNALHTVVQLIPREPKLAAKAAEELAALLRGTIASDRDTTSLADEIAFVEKYLGIERIRFAERLRVRFEVADNAKSAIVPSFSVQTLVENAVLHGATPREAPTEITISATLAVNGPVTISVADNGAGGAASSNGTGLQRLRERLRVMYSGEARLDAGPAAAGGWLATLVVPQHED